MEPKEIFAGLTVDDISVNESGQVVITNPRVAEQLSAVAAANPQLQPTNGNCHGCNAVKGCGATAT